MGSFYFQTPIYSFSAIFRKSPRDIMILRAAKLLNFPAQLWRNSFMTGDVLLWYSASKHDEQNFSIILVFHTKESFNISLLKGR
jgi:hypothetical protein